MCSDRHSRRLLLGAALSLLLLPGCGRRGDPKPAPRAIPRAVSDLEVSQRGSELLIRFSYPTTTVSGLPVRELEALVVEVVRWTPEVSLENLPDAKWKERAEVALQLDGRELRAAVVGGKIAVRWQLPGTEFEAGLGLAVRTRMPGGEWSALSNRVSIRPRTPPPAPVWFETALEPDGVRLRWALPAGAERAGLRLYRRLSQESNYGSPIVELPAGSVEHLDRGVEPGQRYVYALTSLDPGPPPVESSLQAEREILVEDRFPPEPPAGLRALAEPGVVRLLWEPSRSLDTVGYAIERQEPGSSEWRSLNSEPYPGEEFQDAGLTSGLLFRYRVRAVDRSGNASDPSPVEEVLVP